MKINYLSDRWPWFGKHQCYSRLLYYIKNKDIDIRIIQTKDDLSNKLLGKAYSLMEGDFARKDSMNAAAEFKFSRLLKEKDSINHCMFIDNHHRMIKKYKKAPKNLIGTIHHPSGRDFTNNMKENLGKLSSAIIMFKKDLKFYEDLIGKDRVKFIHYGVDTDFFYPKKHDFKEKRLFFTGQNGRNNKMLVRVIRKLSTKHPELKFDLLVPDEIKDRELSSLKANKNIIWHNSLDENKVREIYQKSYLLLMPMDDSGVNTAIVESMACGTPVVTTDVGGIRDYGANSIYPVVENDDDKAMIELIEKYLADEDYRNKIAKKCREFAEKELNWKLIAKKHLEAYEGLIK